MIEINHRSRRDNRFKMPNWHLKRRRGQLEVANCNLKECGGKLEIPNWHSKKGGEFFTAFSSKPWPFDDTFFAAKERKDRKKLWLDLHSMSSLRSFAAIRLLKML